MSKAEEMIRDYKLKYENDDYTVRPIWLKRKYDYSGLAIIGLLLVGVLYAGFRKK